MFAVKLKQTLESVVTTFHSSVFEKNDDSQRGVLNEGIQIFGLPTEFPSHAMPFAYRRADEQARKGNDQHQHSDLGQYRRLLWKYSQGYDDAEIQNKQTGNHALNSVAHGYPNDRDETQIEELQLALGMSEHDPKKNQNDCSLADGLRDRTKRPPRHRFFRGNSSADALGGRRRRESPPEPGKHMDQQERCHDHERDGIAAEPTECRPPELIPGDAMVRDQASDSNHRCEDRGGQGHENIPNYITTVIQARVNAQRTAQSDGCSSINGCGPSGPYRFAP